MGTGVIMDGRLISEGVKEGERTDEESLRHQSNHCLD